MKLVILAAGKGTRMGELTNDTPKPMLKVLGKNLIEHKLEATPLEQISEIVLVVGYLQHVIRDYFGTEYKGVPITYVEDTLQGTGKAVWNAKQVLDEPFLVMMGDDMYHPDDIAMILRTKGGILLDRVKKETKSGKVIIQDHKIVDVIEGAMLQPGEPINAALYHLTPEIFNFELVKLTDRENEWGLPQTIIPHKDECTLTPVYATQWIQITAPEDIEKAERELEK
jgi:UDP-N-acetylglucosamine diphosphorylase / glucose-1-phosphate thymidylyltransferase / UDP-N-acetylgalactosamine diphosphorylase / glucosamine-1-phosphate N-acetyltransferase / galactosamine-1-phosphate N-acetyltransferase